jgi:hypothetical protein
MSYNKPKTASEYNIQHINRILKHVKIQKITKMEAVPELTKRFARLETENIGMYEELYPKFINLAKFN